MSLQVSPKIYTLFQKLVYEPYNGDLKCQHMSVAMCNGKVISPIGCNYKRVYFFGEKRGTFHTEMSTMNYLINLYSSIYDTDKFILKEYSYV